MSERKHNYAVTFTNAILLNDNISVVELTFSYCYKKPRSAQLIQYLKWTERKQICAAILLLQLA